MSSKKHPPPQHAWVTSLFNYICSNLTRCIRMICPNLGGNIHKFIVFNLFSTQPWVKMSPPLKPSINVMDMRQDTSRDAAVKLCPSYSITAALNGSLGRPGAGQYQPFTLVRWILADLLVKHRLLIKIKSWLLLAAWFLNREETWGNRVSSFSWWGFIHPEYPDMAVKDSGMANYKSYPINVPK